MVDLQFVDGKVDSFKYYLWDRQDRTWFLLGGNHNTNVAPGPGVGQISYTLRQDTTTSVPEPSTIGSLFLLGLGLLVNKQLSR